MASVQNSNGSQATLDGVQSDKPVIYTTAGEVLAALKAGQLDAEHANEIIQALMDAGARRAANAVARRAADGCVVTLETFLDVATALPIEVDGVRFGAEPKHFKTGSFGYFANGKATINVGGTPVKCQVQVTITAIGSKPAAK